MARLPTTTLALVTVGAPVTLSARRLEAAAAVPRFGFGLGLGLANTLP